MIVVLVRQIPGGFVPEEDQGYIIVNAQLPDAASLERTDAVMKKAEAILEKNEAIEGFNTITGFSLLTGAYSSNMGFFFVQLKPWEERTTEEEHANGVVAALEPGVRAADSARRASWRSDRRRFRASAPAPASRCSCRIAAAASPEYLAEQTQRFMEAARKRPEIGRISTLYRATVPQVYADIDRSKVLKSGVLAQRREHHARRAARQLLRERLQPVRPRLQGVRAGGARVPAAIPKQLGLFFVRNKTGGMVPLDTLVTTTRPASGPEFTNRFNLFRSAELTGVPAAGLLVDAGARCARGDGARECCRRDMSFDWADMSYQERRAPGVAVVFALAIFLVFLILAAQYESWGLPFSVLLGTPFAAFGAYLGLWLARCILGRAT